MVPLPDGDKSDTLNARARLRARARAREGGSGGTPPGLVCESLPHFLRPVQPSTNSKTPHAREVLETWRIFRLARSWRMP